MERLEQLARKLRGELPGLELREEEPMRNHTTFRIGGPARLMALPRNGKEAAAAVRLAAADLKAEVEAAEGRIAEIIERSNRAHKGFNTLRDRAVITGGEE